MSLESRVVLIGGFVILSSLLLACDSKPIEGTVVNKYHEDREDHSGLRLTPECGLGIDGSYTCGTAKLKYITDIDDEDWVLEIKVCNQDGKCKTHRREVSNEYWTSTEVGDHYADD